MEKRPRIGGQAVMEGVVMRNGQKMAVTVRRQDGTFTLKRYKYSDSAKKPWYKKWLFVRGVVNFVDMMKMGIGCLNDSVKMGGYEEEEPGRFEKWLTKKTGKNAMDVVTGVSLVLGLAFAVGIFFILPSFITTIATKRMDSSIAINFIEGGIRLLIFITYIVLISRLNDIKRFFRYHGAEHKTINAFEAGEKLTVENVQKHTTFHPRCGTSFLVLVMIIAIIVFSLTGWNGQSVLIRVAIRIALLPVVAAISYETLMLLARFDNPVTRVLVWPGKQFQKLTTKEPDDEMVKAAIASSLAVMDEYWYEQAAPEGYVLPGEYSEEENEQKEEEASETENTAAAEEKSEA